MKWRTYVNMSVMILGMVWMVGIGNSWAEELKFPKTSEEIKSILGVKPPVSESQPTGGIPSGGNDQSLFGQESNARGLAKIADDGIRIPDNAPKVGALILFDFDSATIKEESLALLQAFAEAFQSDELQDGMFVIAGYTDNQGTDGYNLSLSKRRAEAIKNFLVAEYQVNANLLKIKAYGKNNPIASNDNEKGRAQNRRAEFIRIQ